MFRKLLLTTALVSLSTGAFAGTNLRVASPMVEAPMATPTVDHCPAQMDSINKMMLSEFDKCWLEAHQGDRTNGVLGSIFWVKVNDKFYSAPISSLRWDLGEEFKATIVADQVSLAQDEAIKAAISQLEEKINTANEVRDILMESAEDVEQLRSIISQHEATIEALEAQIETLMSMTPDNSADVETAYTMVITLVLKQELLV